MELEALVVGMERAIVRGEAWEEAGLVRLVATDSGLAVEVPGLEADHRIGRVSPVDGRFSVFWDQHVAFLVLGSVHPRYAARAVLAIAHAWRQALRLRPAAGGR